MEFNFMKTTDRNCMVDVLIIIIIITYIAFSHN